MSADIITIQSADSEAQSSDAETESAKRPNGPRVACKNTTTFLIGMNSRGQWVARERNGLYGGLFVCKIDAVRYALFENGHRPEAVIEIAGRLELDMSSVPPDQSANYANAV